MKGRNNFLENLKRAQEAKKGEPVQEKPAAAMTDEELQAAESAARRALLDAQHAELREREIARVSGGAVEQAPAATLAGILREKQAGKRRTWR